ncbi:MAG TPA: DUF2809 domain-containing protein [Kofleriaceae bacterium]|nr:DUF2809 domain-containing protein [Kofleriaceae bacterium]
MKRRFLWLAVTALGVGLACLAYAGPGRAFVRGHVGDVAAAMLVYAAFGFTRWPRRVRVPAALAFTVAVELGQTVWSSAGRSGAAALVIGSVFDPWDVVAYGVGVLVGVAWETGWPARRAAR